MVFLLVKFIKKPPAVHEREGDIMGINFAKFGTSTNIEISRVTDYPQTRGDSAPKTKKPRLGRHRLYMKAEKDWVIS